MSIKMIVMDLDDTLLNDDLKISEYNRYVISNAQKMGVKIVLASGRATDSMIKYAKYLKLDERNGFIISFNGAVITDMATGKVLNNETLDSENINFLLKFASDKNLFFQTYIDGNAIASRRNEYSMYEHSITGTPIVFVDNLKESISTDPPKALLMETPEKIKRIEEELRPLVKDKMSMNISKPCFLEFMNINADKDKSISILCDKIGIDKKDVMAVGDSFNDLTMIKGCGLGVVMSNGEEDVKHYASHITSTNNCDGVAAAINKFVLQV